MRQVPRVVMAQGIRPLYWRTGSKRNYSEIILKRATVHRGNTSRHFQLPTAERHLSSGQIFSKDILANLFKRHLMHAVSLLHKISLVIWRHLLPQQLMT